MEVLITCKIFIKTVERNKDTVVYIMSLQVVWWLACALYMCMVAVLIPVRERISIGMLLKN